MELQESSFMSTERQQVHPFVNWLAHFTPMPAKELERFLKFAIVGAIGAVVDFSILNLLALGLGWPDLLANAFSFSIAVISNFTWNRLWTFPESREFPLLSQFGNFAAVNVVGLGINSAVLYFTKILLLHGGLSNALALNGAKAFAILVVLFWNFGANRVSTYREI